MTMWTVVEVDSGWVIISTSVPACSISPIMPERQAFMMAATLAYIATTPLSNR